MTNFILGSLLTIMIALTSFAMNDVQEQNSTQETAQTTSYVEISPENQLTQDEQIEIYEQVMDSCVIYK